MICYRKTSTYTKWKEHIFHLQKATRQLRNLKEHIWFYSNLDPRGHQMHESNIVTVPRGTGNIPSNLTEDVLSNTPYIDSHVLEPVTNSY